MIKNILLGKLPKKSTSKSSQGDPNNDSDISNMNSSNTNSKSPSNLNKNTGANGTYTSSVTKSKLVPVKKITFNAKPYESLPRFADVSPSEKPNLFIEKLKMCCVVFDFTDPSKNLKEKDIKRNTLLELVDYISSPPSKFNEEAIQEITRMVSANLFRNFPSSNQENNLPDVYDAEEDEPDLDPAWTHLQIVYEFFLRFVSSPETDAKLAKRYIDHAFILRLLDLFDSPDQREREYLKTILHRIYGKFMVHRPFIRKSINNIFYRFIFETEKQNGITELLEILGSIINGFALPLKEEHKLFLVRALIPLHKPKCVAMYHQQLSYCITQFVEKDFKLADTVIRGLLKYWPLTNSSKEVMFLGELEEVLESTQAAEFQRCMVPLFRQIRRCLDSSHFQVAERALFLWNNDHVRNLIMQNRQVILPIILPALEKNSKKHWNQAVQSLMLNLRNMFYDSDPTHYNECLTKFQEEEKKERETREKRQQIWKRLDDLAASKSPINEDVLVSKFASLFTKTSSSPNPRTK